MPELPEVERARALLAERALGRRIARVDDTDTWVCRPHAPGEIAGAREGASLIEAHRRGKAMWVDTDRGPVLGLHLGMAGRIVIDEEPHPLWDRFALGRQHDLSTSRGPIGEGELSGLPVALSHCATRGRG